MMRWLVILLLLGNIFVYAWHYNEQLNSRTETVLAETRIPPGTPSLTLLAELATEPTLRPKSERSALAVEGADADVMATTEINTDAIASNTCIRTGPFSDDEAFDSFKAWLRPRTKTLHAEVETTKTEKFFWVYLEPSSDDATRDNLADLERKGVEDYMLIRQGNLKNAISLGLFRSQDSVNRRLEEMTEQGYHPVVVPKFNKEVRYWVDASLAQGFEDVEMVETELGGGVELLEIECVNLTASAE